MCLGVCAGRLRPHHAHARRVQAARCAAHMRPGVQPHEQPGGLCDARAGACGRPASAAYALMLLCALRRAATSLGAVERAERYRAERLSSQVGLMRAPAVNRCPGEPLAVRHGCIQDLCIYETSLHQPGCRARSPAIQLCLPAGRAQPECGLSAASGGRRAAALAACPLSQLSNSERRSRGGSRLLCVQLWGTPPGAASRWPLSAAPMLGLEPACLH